MSNPTHIFNSLTSLLIAGLGFLAITFSFPSSIAALSCVAPEKMIKEFVNRPEYTIVQVEAGKLETKGSEHNQQVTFQLIYKGSLPPTDTVTFSFEKTWNYLCAGNPALVGEKALYVLHNKRVVHVFSIDSKLALELTSQLPQPSQATNSLPQQTETGYSPKQQIISIVKKLFSLLSH